MPILRALIKCFAAPLPLALAACGGSHGYPSLAQRPVERIVLAVPPAPTPPPAPAPLPAGLAGKAARLLDDVRAAHGRFVTLDARIGAAAQTGGANTALGQLESARAATSSLVATLEQLYLDDRLANAVADGSAAEDAPRRPAALLLAEARASALALLAAEDATLARRMTPAN